MHIPKRLFYTCLVLFILFVSCQKNTEVEADRFSDPSIAEKYLTMADGGMIDKQLKSLQNGLQNMYNGIPSVKRR